MSELGIRLIVILAGLVVVAVAIWIMRRTRRDDPIPVHHLESGIYLFSSSTCADCSEARALLVDELGTDGFTEIRWEERPDLFTELAIDAVPCTVVVSADGAASRFPGSPQPGLRRLNP